MLKNELNALKGMKISLIFSNDQVVEGVLVDVKQDHIVVSVNQIIHYYVLNHICTLSHNTKDQPIKSKTVHYLNRSYLEDVLEELLYNWVTIKSFSNQSFAGVLSKITESHLIIIKNSERFFIQKTYLSTISSEISEENVILSNKKRIESRRMDSSLKNLKRETKVEQDNEKLKSQGKHEEKVTEQKSIEISKSTESTSSNVEKQQEVTKKMEQDTSHHLKTKSAGPLVQNVSKEEELVENRLNHPSKSDKETSNNKAIDDPVAPKQINLTESIEEIGEKAKEKVEKAEVIVKTAKKDEKLNEKHSSTSNNSSENTLTSTKNVLVNSLNTFEDKREQKIEGTELIPQKTIDEAVNIRKLLNESTKKVSDMDKRIPPKKDEEALDPLRTDFSKWVRKMEENEKRQASPIEQEIEKPRTKKVDRVNNEINEIEQKNIKYETLVELDNEEDALDNFGPKKKRILVTEWSTNLSGNHATESFDKRLESQSTTNFTNGNINEAAETTKSESIMLQEERKEILEKQYYALMNYAALNSNQSKPTPTYSHQPSSLVQANFDDVKATNNERPSFVTNQYNALMKHAEKMYYQIMRDE